MLRGEIWLYNANPTLGDEISKIRPAIIVNNDPKTSAADTFQIRSVSQERLIRKIGFLDCGTMQLISQALAIVLNIDQ